MHGRFFVCHITMSFLYIFFFPFRIFVVLTLSRHYASYSVFSFFFSLRCTWLATVMLLLWFKRLRAFSWRRMSTGASKRTKGLRQHLGALALTFHTYTRHTCEIAYGFDVVWCKGQTRHDQTMRHKTRSTQDGNNVADLITLTRRKNQSGCAFILDYKGPNS